MKPVRWLFGILFIAFGLSFIARIVQEWDRVDKYGEPRAYTGAMVLVAFVGIGLALLWPVRQMPATTTKRRLRDIPALVYFQRVVAALCISFVVAFALRIPRDWHHARKHHSAPSDIALVVAFGGPAVIFLRRRQNLPTTATSS